MLLLTSYDGVCDEDVLLNFVQMPATADSDYVVEQQPTPLEVSWQHSE